MTGTALITPILEMQNTRSRKENCYGLNVYVFCPNSQVEILTSKVGVVWSWGLQEVIRSCWWNPYELD
jgi:hypothetical protein